MRGGGWLCLPGRRLVVRVKDFARNVGRQFHMSAVVDEHVRESHQLKVASPLGVWRPHEKNPALAPCRRRLPSTMEPSSLVRADRHVAIGLASSEFHSGERNGGLREEFLRPLKGSRNYRFSLASVCGKSTFGGNARMPQPAYLHRCGWAASRALGGLAGCRPHN